MNPTLGINIHRKRVADSVLKIRSVSDESPMEILLSRCAVYEYFIDDLGLRKQFSKWIEKKKIQDQKNG
ncbi:hypothetical protein [Leptospira interrogans]|uniref:hypothetical protein n=1 Tax=Leptospira interrogans TaxID=173 RepID=UPI00051B4697|nr:hypothetical protein [Leptospira interrogans]